MILVILLAGAVVKYCNKYVCVSVCLSVCEDISGTIAHERSLPFFLHVAYGRASVLLR